MNFDGNFRSSKRKVDLRGSSKQDDKAKLLEKARIDRENRARLRLENRSALRIQAFYRGRRVVGALRAQVREEWKLAYGVSGERATGSDLSPECKYLRQLVFFVRLTVPDDLQRLVRACSLILSAVHPRDHTLAFCKQDTDLKGRGELVNRCKQLLLLCVNALVANRAALRDQLHAPPSSQQSGTASVLLDTLLKLTSAESWSALEDGCSLTRPAELLLQYVINKAPLFVCLRALLLDVPVPGGGRPPPAGALGAAAAPASLLEIAAFTVALRHIAAVQQGAVSEAAIAPTRRFGPNLLTVPLLWQRCRLLLSTPLVSRVVWSHAVLTLADVLLPPRLPRAADGPFHEASAAALTAHVAATLPAAEEYPAAAWLLGNLLEAAPKALAAQASVQAAVPGLPGVVAPDAALLQRAAVAFAALADLLLACVPPSMFLAHIQASNPLASQDDDEAPGPTPPRAPAGLLSASPSAPAPAWGALPPALAAQLKVVGNPELLQNLVSLTLPLAPGGAGAARPSDSAGGGGGSGSGAGGGGGGGPGEAVAWAEGDGLRVCSLLYAALAAVPGQHAQVLNGLAFHAGVVPRLWRQITACQADADRWPHSAGVDCQLQGSLQGWAAPMAVLAPVYSFVLMTTDDEDFFRGQTPLPLDQLPLLVHLLKGWLSSLLNGEAARERGTLAASVHDYALTWMSKLLTQLHDRNCRHRFVAPNAFHAMEVVGTNFAAEVAADEEGHARRVLYTVPALVPFAIRVECIRHLIAADRETIRASQSHQQQFAEAFAGGRVITVRRQQLVHDGFEALSQLGMELRRPLRIQFVDQFGEPEAGVDGGGLFKNFLDLITREAFNPQYGLFTATEEQQLYPNPASHLASSSDLHYFEFLGRILGKALYEGILVELPFAAFFLSKLRGRPNELNDLPSLDPDLYKNLLFLKRYQGDVTDLSLFFVVVNEEYGEAVQTELLPGGANLPVTNQNVLRYIHLMANHRLNTQIRQQSMAFLRGLQDLVSLDWIKIFNEEELQMLISGSQGAIDVQDLRANTSYAGGYSEHHPVIAWFWEVLEELSPREQAEVLRFVTACSRGPLLGFRYLEPQFCIQRAGVAGSGAADSTADMDRLPTAATCMNLLKLPPYPTRETVREKVLYAINSGAGFDLS